MEAGFALRKKKPASLRARGRLPLKVPSMRAWGQGRQLNLVFRPPGLIRFA